MKFFQGMHLFLAVATLRAHIIYRVGGRPGPYLDCLRVWCSGGPLSCVCDVSEEVLRWAGNFARYPPVFGRNCHKVPHKLQS